VNDGTVNSATDKVVVTVLNVDHSLFIKEQIEDISVDKRSPDKIIDLSDVFADNDSGDVLTFKIASNTNENIVVAKIENSLLTLKFFSKNIGFAEIEIPAN
jgi:anti-anti-sigma regulatory factor